MSTQSPFGGRTARAYPTLPKGETVASFDTYAEAQAAVDTLAKAAFPVKEVAIVGTGLTSVERITGTLSWGRAAGAGALSGAWFGTFLGLLFFIFSPTGAGLGILISAVLIGAGFGMIFSVVSYSINRRRRDFTSVAQVLATRYAIITESAHADRARSVLGVDATHDSQAAPAASASASAPMSYGEATDAARRAAAAQSAQSEQASQSEQSAQAAQAAQTPRERPRYGELAPSPEETDAEASASSDDEAERPGAER